MNYVYWNAATTINEDCSFILRCGENRYACHAINEAATGAPLKSSDESDNFTSVFCVYEQHDCSKMPGIFGVPSIETQNERIIALLFMHWMVNDKVANCA
jgi:hypothetical protein